MKIVKIFLMNGISQLVKRKIVLYALHLPFATIVERDELTQNRLKQKVKCFVHFFIFHFMFI